MPDLRSAIDDLAKTFATSIVAAIRASNLDDLVGLAEPSTRDPRRRGPGRPKGSTSRLGTKKASPSGTPSTASLTQRIAEHIEAHPGQTGEVARAALGVTKPRWSKAVALAVATGKLRKEGERRATRYFPA
jgi:hypothetical protein